jgi:hypothetical protein
MIGLEGQSGSACQQGPLGAAIVLRRRQNTSCPGACERQLFLLVVGDNRSPLPLGFIERTQHVLYPLVDRPGLFRQVADLHDRRRRVPGYLPDAHSEFERRLPKERSPAVARHWGFYMNMSVESFRSSLERHRNP